MNDLFLFTTDELIQELFNRKLFAGVLVYSAEEQRFEGQIHNEVKVLATPDKEHTIKMLQVGVSAVEALDNRKTK